MTNAEKKLAFLLATSPYLDTLDGSYEKAAKDLVANGVTVRDAENIDPESLRPQGEWVWKPPNGWACSNCGEWGLMIDNRGIAKSNYCPNCGAKMKGETK